MYIILGKGALPQGMSQRGAGNRVGDPLRDKGDKAKKLLKTLPGFYDSGKRGQRV